jgi:hypothetical protein
MPSKSQTRTLRNVFILGLPRPPLHQFLAMSRNETLV